MVGNDKTKQLRKENQDLRGKVDELKIKLDMNCLKMLQNEVNTEQFERRSGEKEEVR